MRYFGLLFLMIYSTIVHAATVEPCLFSARHKLNADSDTIIRKRSVSVGVTYGNDAIFFGRTSPVKYPFVTADFVYNDKSGLFIYGSALKVLEYDPVFDELDVGGGYFYKLSKKFSGAISYTRFIFNKDARIIKSASSNDINFKNTYDWKYMKSSIVADFLFGKSNDFFITASTSKSIEPNWSIFSDDDYITFNPSVNVIFGTQNFVKRYSEDRFRRLNIDQVNPVAPSMSRNNGRFTVLNYYLKVPVAYNTPHLTLEASYRYSIPVNVENMLMNRHASFLNLTFYYLFY